MAIRCGYSVGKNTSESSLSDQLKKFPAKIVLAPPEDHRDRGKQRRSLYRQSDQVIARNSAQESLLDKCILVVAENFHKRPVKTNINPALMSKVTALVPTDIPPILGARYIQDEGYWKRCSVEKHGWHNCILAEHGQSWKQLYFEKYIQARIEDFDPQTDELEQLYELVDACADYIFTLSFEQLPSHIDLSELCSLLPNLSKIDMTYGVTKIGINYERILFGMKISDATSLAKVFDRVDCLTTVCLPNNIIDDDLLRMLMTGLIKNSTITALDFSHNKITNHGARLIAKLLGGNSVISQLNLCDNQLQSEGGRYLARGIRENDSLIRLNLRLNRLTDEGCRLLFEGIQDNNSLTDLNISCNGASAQAAQTLFSILRDPNHHLSTLDISGNDFDSNQFEMLRLSMSGNKSLTSLDCRQNPGYNDALRAIKEIDGMVHFNEVAMRAASGYPF